MLYLARLHLIEPPVSNEAFHKLLQLVTKNLKWGKNERKKGRQLWGNWKTLDLHSHMHRNDLTWQLLKQFEQDWSYWRKTSFLKFLKISKNYIRFCSPVLSQQKGILQCCNLHLSECEEWTKLVSYNFALLWELLAYYFYLTKTVWW